MIIRSAYIFEYVLCNVYNKAAQCATIFWRNEYKLFCFLMCENALLADEHLFGDPKRYYVYSL
jgi:hypothetical protein